eukprot:CAMPEP_0113668680 /NCGR_PEP_ID=MMETSP0038_2-20120614/4135_1 /TAXON_ID=2898 /ORGANISM="Cryptomonas paramecium" /LENGTH=71 /DNA_ID=CAMNT_0000584451 /DNA_START=113 /DNA_END=328 /DNA_ORIENTATION=+ /assembly_acc=CAM_ASM_000170
MAKSAAEKAVNEVKNTNAYKTASYKVQQGVTEIKRSEAFNSFKNSEAGQFAEEFAKNVVKELKQGPGSKLR